MRKLILFLPFLCLGQTFELPIPWGPINAAYPQGTPSYANFSLNQSNDAVEQYYTFTRQFTVTKVRIAVASVAGTPPTYRVALEGVASNGYPDGIIKSGGQAYADFQPTATGWYELTLGASYTASAYEALAVTIKYQSGTIDASNYASFRYGMTYTPNAYLASQFKSGTVDGGSRTRRINWPAVNLVDEAGNRWPGFDNHGDIAYSSSYEAGVRIFVPCSMAAALVVRGAEFYANQNNSGTLTVTLYDSQGNTLAQRAEAHLRYGNASGYALHSVLFTSDVVVRCGTPYTLGITTSVTSSTYLMVWSLTNAPWVPWSGVWYGRQRPVGGSWTDYTNYLPWAHLLVSRVIGPVGSLMSVGQ